MQSNLTDQNLENEMMSLVERRIKFSVLLILLIPSLFCTIFIFYHFQWRQINNQIYGYLLFVNGLIISTELPVTLYFLYEGKMSEDKCQFWIILNYSLFQSSIYLMTWTSIERYLFIYHEQMILRHQIILHYFPILLIYLYCPLFYIGVVILYKCQTNYNEYFYICGGPCYSLDLTLGLIDWIGNGISMEMTILFVNIILILRHLIQRHRIKNSILTNDKRKQWRRSVKLSIQLLSIAMIYIFAWIPYSIIVLIQMFRNSPELSYILTTFLVYLPYLQSLILPYISILFLPNVKQKLICLNRIKPTQNPIQLQHIQRNTTAFQLPMNNND